MFDSTVRQNGKGRSAPRRPQGSTGGFTLVELMLVVAVMSIIMAMAIPSFLNARIAANESSAISTMRAVVTSNEQYRTRFQSYAGALTDLWAEGYIDASVANPFKAGYTFSYVGGVNTYSFNGEPTNVGASGYRYFYADNTGVIRFNGGAPAGPGDPAIGD